MSQATIEKVIEQIDGVHRKLAQLSVDQLLGTPAALSTADALSLYPVPLRPKTTTFLKQALKSAESAEETERIERLLFGCIDLAVAEQIASLTDMLRFYMERGRMLVGPDKIPTVEVVPWLQSQADFDKREIMRKEITIFLKGIINPILLGMLELTVKTVTETFGYGSYVEFSQAKKKISFQEQADEFKNFLDDTSEVYRQQMEPWVQKKIGRSMNGLNRHHALYLMRISRFDEYFPVSRLGRLTMDTFKGVGLDLSSRSDVILEIADSVQKNPDGICIGVEIPGEVHVITKPVGGLIDVETLLHETGHAFFLSHMDPQLPCEYRRLYRSAALDETFAFLFTDLLDNVVWLTRTAKLPQDKADELARLFRTKRLCLIRRHIGKFLAEKELHESGNIKDSEPYCRWLNRATGFEYEPQGYLIDMEPDFYALDYLNAWAGAHVLRVFLETRFGEDWFQKAQAGDFLKEIAWAGRRNSLDTVITSFCGETLRFPDFNALL